MKRLYEIFRSVIDAPLAFLGAISLGAVVFWINLEHGWEPALIAALKQGVYTFFFGGFVLKICAYFAKKTDPLWVAAIAWALIPATVTVIATFTVHSLRGTPEPFMSTIPTLASAPFSFLIIGYFKRKNARAEVAE